MRINVTENMVRVVSGTWPATLWRSDYLKRCGTVGDIHSLAALVILEKGVKLGLASGTQYRRWAMYLAKHLKRELLAKNHECHSICNPKDDEFHPELLTAPEEPETQEVIDGIKHSRDRELIRGYCMGEYKGDRTASERARRAVKRQRNAIIRLAGGMY